MKNYCLYHNQDFDGFSSATIVKYYLNNDVELIGMNYGYPMPEIEDNSTVYIVDFSLPPKDLIELCKRSYKVFWFDHHISQIKEFDETTAPSNLYFNLNSKFAGCELTWKYLFKDLGVPQIITLLGTYDSWKKEEVGGEYWNSTIIPFQLGMKSICNSVESFPRVEDWDEDYFVTEMIDFGEVIQNYKTKEDQITCKLFSYEIEFQGFKAIVLNTPQFSSNSFNSVYDEAKHDIMIAYCINKEGKIKVSLYSTKPYVDCSNLAKRHGGGGHFGASGFILEVKNIGILLPK